MADAQTSAEVLLFTNEVSASGSVNVPGLKDNCTCSQGRFENSAMEDSSYRKMMSTFDPGAIGSIGDFMRLRGSLNQESA